MSIRSPVTHFFGFNQVDDRMAKRINRRSNRCECRIPQRSGFLQRLTVLGVLLFVAGTAVAKAFIIEPALTGLSPDSITLTWVTEHAAEAGEVVVIPEKGGIQQRVVPKQSVPPFLNKDKKEKGGKLDYVRSVAVLTGLQPRTRYRYQVTVGDENVTGEFRTAPALGDRSAFTFSVISDTHNTHTEAAKAIAKEKSAFVIIDGDFISGTGSTWSNWLEFFSSARPYMQTTPIVPVIGGHDVKPANNFRALFSLDNPDGQMPNKDACYYTTTYGNLRYIILDTYMGKKNMDEQLVWLENVLKDNASEWTLVAFHEPAFASGSRGMLDNRPEFVDLFERYGVDFVICGHNHIYERLLPFGADNKKPVFYVSINTRGNFRAVRPSPIVQGGIGQQVLCYAQFQVNGDELTMLIKGTDGTLVDRLNLIKQKGKYQAEINEQAIPLELARRIAHIYTLNGRVKGMYDRKDIQIELATIPEAGKPLRAVLDTSAFPEGSRLHVLSGTDPNQWRATAHVSPVGQNGTNVELIPPNNLTIQEDGSLKPEMTLQLNFEYQQRIFNEVTVVPTLGPQTRALLGSNVTP